jgi:glycosyltransferase involved in cell wall biosynthesis
MSDRRLRVLQLGKFYPPHMGGIETHVEVLCQSLRDRVEVQVAVASDTWRSKDEVVRRIKVSRVGNIAHMTSAPICPGLVRRIRQSRADVVHLHLPNPGGMLALIASGYKGSVVLTYHSDVVRQWLLAALFQPVLKHVLERCAAVVATSEKYMETSPILREHWQRCRVIPYGISLDRFNKVDSRTIASIRAQFGSRIVLAVGRLVYYKGFKFLVRAMQDVDARLLLIGDGPLKSELQQEARAAGVADRVTFLGEIQNHRIAPFFHAADVFVLPSIARSEAFGIVQLEAMACGTPVINTWLPSGVPAVSLDGVTGMTVPPADSRSLTNAVNSLLNDSTLRTAYGEAARRRVRAEFTLERMGNRVAQLYQDVLAAEKRPLESQLDMTLGEHARVAYTGELADAR